MFDSFFGGKSWFKSLTGWALFIFLMAETAIPALAELGVVNIETTALLTGWLEKGALVLGTVGIRRKLPEK
jgi:hypothetical protein